MYFSCNLSILFCSRWVTTSDLDSDLLGFPNFSAIPANPKFSFPRSLFPLRLPTYCQTQIFIVVADPLPASSRYFKRPIEGLIGQVPSPLHRYIDTRSTMATTRTALSRHVPLEIILEILKACETFEQLTALLLTSKRIYSVWELHHGVVIWHVAPRVIPAFDRALITVCVFFSIYWN